MFKFVLFFFCLNGVCDVVCCMPPKVWEKSSVCSNNLVVTVLRPAQLMVKNRWIAPNFLFALSFGRLVAAAVEYYSGVQIIYSPLPRRPVNPSICFVNGVPFERFLTWIFNFVCQHLIFHACSICFENQNIICAQSVWVHNVIPLIRFSGWCVCVMQQQSGAFDFFFFLNSVLMFSSINSE